MWMSSGVSVSGQFFRAKSNNKLTNQNKPAIVIEVAGFLHLFICHSIVS
jgi:hypothetical protein